MTFAAQLFHIGQLAQVKAKQKVGENDFGNAEFDWVDDREVIAFQTYPNRNTEVSSNAGDRIRDRALFLIPVGEEQNDPPEGEDRLVYDGELYELGGRTSYDSHIEIFGEVVLHEDQDDGS